MRREDLVELPAQAGRRVEALVQLVESRADRSGCLPGTVGVVIALMIFPISQNAGPTGSTKSPVATK